MEGVEVSFLTWHRKERKNMPRYIPMLGGRMRWRVEMVLFEMDGGDQREPLLNFKLNPMC